MTLTAYRDSCFAVVVLVPLQEDVVWLDISMSQGWCALVHGFYAVAHLSPHYYWHADVAQLPVYTQCPPGLAYKDNHMYRFKLLDIVSKRLSIDAIGARPTICQSHWHEAAGIRIHYWMLNSRHAFGDSSIDDTSQGSAHLKKDLQDLLG